MYVNSRKKKYTYIFVKFFINIGKYQDKKRERTKQVSRVGAGKERREILISLNGESRMRVRRNRKEKKGAGKEGGEGVEKERREREREWKKRRKCGV